MTDESKTPSPDEEKDAAADGSGEPGAPEESGGAGGGVYTRRHPITANLILVVFALVALATVFGFAFRSWRPEVASVHGKGIDNVITYLLVTTGIFFCIGQGTLLYFVWRYRQPGARGDRTLTLPKQWMWSFGPALVVGLIAEVGVLFIGMPVFDQVYGETDDDAIAVEVLGVQFAWWMRYPGEDGVFGEVLPERVDESQGNPFGLETKGMRKRLVDDDIFGGILVLEVNRMAAVRVRSKDVIHSFSIPEFRVKQDALPGYTAETQFTPTRVGQYEVACMELCGLGHYRMKGWCAVVEAEVFEALMAPPIPGAAEMSPQQLADARRSFFQEKTATIEGFLEWRKSILNAEEE